MLNNLKGSLKVVAIKSPGFGDRKKEMLEDIAILTNGEVITEQLGTKLENVNHVSMLGTANKVIVTKDHTTIVHDKHNSDIERKVNSRCEQIREAIKDTTSDYEKEKLQERLAKLRNGVAVLKVGGATEVEQKERKDRVEDALHATRAAVEEGIVPGGGVALFYASRVLDSIECDNEDQRVGINIVKKVLEAPLRQIVKNAGGKEDVVVNKLSESNDNNLGFDARTMQYVDMIKTGIVDPTKVVRTALQDAFSVALLVISTLAMITDHEEDNNANGRNSSLGGGGHHGMGGGMDF
ncbi:TCP-1/cpn60 chaperonin family protein [Orientia chuto str. Dubai]|uniref:60 kDa chaperonin n=1 Tax=Orientia chuto str. Dubai TaxID=1359168 RepID=A0A0F3MN40_9RICK|nr:TCP-1/cpn60 chaperonin family protein [Orientia chuto str. Dubai]